MSLNKRIRPYMKKCIVKGCESGSNPDLNVCFHQFPDPDKRFVYTTDYFGNKQKVDQLIAWLVAVGITKEVVSRRTRICSLHFTKDDYFFPDLPASRLILKRNAVPSVNLSQGNEKRTRSEARLERRLKRERGSEPVSVVCGGVNNRCLPVDEIEGAHDFELVVCPPMIESDGAQDYELVINYGDDHNYCLKEKTVPDDSVIRIDLTNSSSNVLEVSDPIGVPLVNPVTVSAEPIQCLVRLQHDFGVQVNQKYRFFDVIKSDKQLNSVTGIKNFEILHKIVDKMNQVTQKRYEKNTVIMTTKKRVIITFVKLKHDVSYTFLAAIFDSVSQLTCRRIYIETVQFLNKYLDELAIPWPSDLGKILENICISVDSSKDKDDGSFENEKDNT